MVQHHNGCWETSKSTLGRKKQFALALAVSLWIAGGGAASAQETTVASNYTGDVFGNHTGDDLSNYNEDPNDNTVTVNAGVTISGDGTASGSVYGSLGTENAAAERNKVIINGTVTGYVYGGKSGQAEANSNMVTINGEVKGSVYGGTGTLQYYAAYGNMVTIKGTAWEDVYGGFGQEGATGNSVTVIDGTVKKDVYGGYISYNADATSNQVTLSGATVEGNVYGGYTRDYGQHRNETTYNQVTLNGATVGRNVYGGFNESDETGDVTTGNTLYLFGASTAGGAVENFEKIVLRDSLDREYADGTQVQTATYSLAWQDDAALLSAKEFKNYGTLDISGATVLKNHTTPGVMTLLQSATANNFVNLPLKYWDGTATLTAAGIVVKAGTAKTGAEAGVTLDYQENAHSVMLASVGEGTNNAVNYAIGNHATKLTFGAPAAWSTTTPYCDLKDKGYVFGDYTSIDASGLTFTGMEPVTADPMGQSMTLLANAAGAENILAANITQPTDAPTMAVNMAVQGVKLAATATGSVGVAKDAVKFTVDNVALTGVDLTDWDGTTASVPTGWTSNLGNNSVTAEGFTAPTIAAGASTNILTTTTDKFFNDDQITGAMKYKADAESADTINGVTLTGAESKGVKAAENGKSLVYARSDFNVSGVALGTMTWGTPRTMAATGYNFADTATIDATNLTFTNPEAATGSMTLLSNAENLAAGANIAHTQAFDTMAANGATLTATLSGNVTRTAGTLGYTATGTTLDSVNLTNWDGTTASVPTGWTSNLGANSVTAEGFTAPTIAAGASTNILTATTDNFFNDDQITGAMKYKADAESSDTVNGVTLTGAESKGVKAAENGKNLVYARSDFNVSGVSLGGMTWGTDRDGSGAAYNYAGVSALDTSGLALTIANPESVKAGDSTTFLKANDTLKDMAAQAAKDVAYSVSPAAGVSVSAAVRGSVSARGGSVVYTATANQATKLTFTNVDWLNTGALIDHKTTLANISFEGADVDTTKISFTNLQTLDTDSKMTLVSDFGTSAGTINGSTFTVGKGTGEGYAYLKDSDLVYLVTKGVSGDTPTPTPTEDISAQTRTVEPGTTVTENVVAAEATGDETATSNTAEVVKGGIVGTADNPANLTGATTESGAAKENKANITGGTVTGNVTGAATGSGDATGNTATVTGGGTVTGSNPEETFAVAGARTESGTAEGNKATVGENSTVMGAVVGAAVTGGALADGNAANITGGSTVNGDVMGSFVDTGNITGNTANVEKNSTVNGDILGAYSTDGDAVANHAVVSDSTVNVNTQSKCDGDVMGAQTENGVASGNTATVTGKNSKVAGQVAGGIISHEGEANSNEAHVSGATVGYGVYGGLSARGSVTGNIATVDGGATVNGEVKGGETDVGDADGNKATVTDSMIGGDVYGGYSEVGSVSGNNAVVIGSTVKIDKAEESKGDVIGGAAIEGAVSGNMATVTDSVIGGDVYGGYSGKGTAEGNKVEISGETEIDGTVYGGKSTEKSEGNKVTMTGGTVNKIVGGGCETGANNIVTISGGTVHAVYGAEAGKSATGNQIIMSGGTVDGVLYGGFSDSQTGTVNNVITLYGDADVSNANIYGGNGTDATGNLLVIGLKDSDVLSNSKAWTGGEVKNLANLETVRLDVVEWGKTALTITDGSKTDLSQTTINAKNVHFKNADALPTDKAMMLLDDSNVDKENRAKAVEVGTFTADSTLQGTGSFELDKDGNIVYKVDSVTSSDQSHNAVMGMSAGMAALSAGNDFIGSATEGLALTSNTGADGVSSFAKLGGGSMRQETGSHVNVHTWNAILALGHKNKKEKSTTEYGAFFEYGSGNYSTFNDADQRGDGNMNYTGGGLLAKWTAKHGFYVEGSLRAGTVHDDARNVLRDYDGRPFSYETNANYFGAHLGVGKEITLPNGNTVDVYGKYFFNRRNGVSFNAGGHYDLDAVTSQILRVGARYTVKRNQWDFYVGAAYEHEMDGKATGTADGLAIQSADPSGGSFRGEIGATMRPGENSPWQLDLNVAGFAGKKQGFTGGISVAFLF